MSIGTTIKRLRRERDITQEQLADMLGISSRAVSQWECERTAPDISQLPLLASIFEVSADLLLGIDIGAKEKRIGEYVSRAEERLYKGYPSEADEILREGLREYPDSFRLMSGLMSGLFKERDESEDRRAELTAELIRLGEKILDNCTDDSLRRNAIQLLCFVYPEVGEEEKAVALAEKMPGRYLTGEMLLASIYRGNRRYGHMQDMLSQDLDDLYFALTHNNRVLDDGTHPYSLEEQIELYKKWLAIVDIIIEDRNYGFHGQLVSWTYVDIARLYAELGDYDAAAENLRLGAELAIKQDEEYDPEGEYTCLALRGKKFGGVLHNIAENDSLHQLGEMEDSAFAPMRGREDFGEIIGMLQRHAAKR